MASFEDLVNNPGVKSTDEVKKSAALATGGFTSMVGPGGLPATDYDDLMKSASEEHGVPYEVLYRNLKQESGFNPKAISKSGARGIAQFIPSTAKAMGIKDPHDPKQAIPGAAKYIRQLYDQFGDWKLAIAAYNAGPTAVAKAGGIPDIEETKNHVKAVFPDDVQFAGPAETRFASSFDELINKPIQAQAPSPEPSETRFVSGEQPKSPFGLSTKEYYSSTAIAPPFQGMGMLGFRSPEINTYMYKKFGIGPKVIIDELGRPVDEKGNPFTEAEPNRGFIQGIIADTFKGLGGLVTHPDRAAMGLYNLMAAMPGFMLGVIGGAGRAGKELIDQLAYTDVEPASRAIDIMHGISEEAPGEPKRKINFEQVYNALMGGIEEGMKFYKPAQDVISFPETKESVLSAEVAMAPYIASTGTAKEISNIELFKDSPNVRGLIKIFGEGFGLALNGFLLHGSSRRAEFAKQTTEVVKEATALRDRAVNLETIPETLVREIERKKLEIDKQRLEAKAAQFAEKFQDDVLVIEEMGRQAEEVAKAKSRPVTYSRKEMTGRAPEIVEGKEAVTTKSETGLVEGFKGLAKGISESFYNQAFEALKNGKTKVAGIREPIVIGAKEAFDRGEIKSADDLRNWAESNYFNKTKQPPAPAPVGEPIYHGVLDARNIASIYKEGLRPGTAVSGQAMEHPIILVMDRGSAGLKDTKHRPGDQTTTGRTGSIREVLIDRDEFIKVRDQETIMMDMIEEGEKVGLSPEALGSMDLKDFRKLGNNKLYRLAEELDHADKYGPSGGYKEYVEQIKEATNGEVPIRSFRLDADREQKTDFRYEHKPEVKVVRRKKGETESVKKFNELPNNQGFEVLDPETGKPLARMETREAAERYWENAFGEEKPLSPEEMRVLDNLIEEAEAPVETTRKAEPKLPSEQIDYFGEREIVNEVDRAAGERVPELEEPTGAFMRSQKEVDNLHRIYEERAKSVAEDPELFTQKLINDARRWYYGNKEVNIDSIRSMLSELSSRSNELRDKFMTGVDHLQWAETVSEAAKWARGLERAKVGEPVGTRLNMMIPVDQIPASVRLAFKTIFGGTKAALKDVIRNKRLFDMTGFWFSRDGKWRYEIDDSKASLNLDASKRLLAGEEVKLTDLLEHPELYSKVPEITNTTVRWNNDIKKGNARYLIDEDTIIVNGLNKRTLLHETQHDVNVQLGSAFRGTNPEYTEFQLLKDKLRLVLPNVKTKKGVETVKWMLDKAEENYIPNVDYLEKHKGTLGISDAQIEYLREPLVEKAFENYKRDPGEMESRLTEARFDAPKGEYPWETLDKMLEKEGRAASIGQKLYSGVPLDEAYKLIKSWSNNHKELLTDIVKLMHRGKIDLDVNYSSGKMWNGIPDEFKPKIKMDKFPQDKDTISADISKRIPLEDNSIESIFSDPPYLVAQERYLPKKMSDRFGYFKSLDELLAYHDGSMREFSRILKPGGRITIKLQDISRPTGERTSTISKAGYEKARTYDLPITDYVKRFASKYGLRYLGKSVYVNEGNLMYKKGTTQRVPRKAHAEFLTFENTTKDVLPELEALRKYGIKLFSGAPLDEAARAIAEGSRKVVDYIRKSRDYKKFRPREAYKITVDQLNNAINSKSGNSRRELLKGLGDDGYKVIQSLYLSRGGSARSSMYLDQLKKEVYSGLGSDLKEITDAVILSVRMIDIAGYKTPGKDFVFPDGRKLTDFIGLLNAFDKKAFNGIRDLTPSEKIDVTKRVKSYYDWMKKALTDLKDEGLITEKEYNDLIKHNYRRLESVDKIYDKPYKVKVGGKTITVHDSGIESLQRGKKTDIYEGSSELMALEVFNRTYGRIMKNRANLSLLDVARKFPDNPFVRVREKGKKLPPGWSTVLVVENGVRKAIHLAPEFAKEWITSSPDVSYRAGRVMQYVFGTPLLRLFATGIEWSFAAANLIKDLWHIEYAAQAFENGKWKQIYNPVKPIYGLQIGADIKAVFNDALNKTGRYRDYINEGGGMEFLVHQGRLFRRGQHLESTAGGVLDKLGRPGEVSELMTRLAIRERVIKRRAKQLGISVEEARKNKDITKEASFVARDYMDFGDKGWLTQIADNAIPYVGATVAATRGLFRAFKPGRGSAFESTFRMAQFGTLVGGLTAATIILAPKTDKELKGDDRVKDNLIIPLGDEFGFEDEYGDMRYMFLKVPIDSSQKFFKAFFDATTRKSLGEEIDPVEVAKTLKELSPVDISSLPPTVAAALGYWNNTNYWRNEPIVREPFSYPKSAEEWDRRTPELYKDIGGLTGLSPERTKYAVGQLITSGGMWGSLVTGGYDRAFGNVPGPDRQRHIAQILADTPILKRFFGITNPYAKHGKKIDKAEEEARLNNFIQTRNMDTKVFGYLYDKNVSLDEVTSYAESFGDKDVYDKLMDRFKWEVAIKDLPEKSFWRRMKGLPVEAKARVFVDRLNSADESERQKLMEELGIVMNAKGIISKEFKKEVTRLMESQ